MDTQAEDIVTCTDVVKAYDQGKVKVQALRGVNLSMESAAALPRSAGHRARARPRC